MDIEPLRLEAGKAIGDGLETLADGIEMVQSLLEAEVDWLPSLLLPDQGQSRDFEIGSIRGKNPKSRR